MRTPTRLLTPLILLLALLLPASGATAAPTESLRVEGFLFAINGCNGESVPMEGTTHIVSKRQKGVLVEHVTIHGQGVGDRGNEYVLNHSFTFRETVDGSSSDDRIQLISKGSAPNQVLLTHFDPDTGFTVDTDCRG